MTQADEIREFAYQNYIKPARDKGLDKVTIRAGDLHEEMGLGGKIPAICGALDTNKFQKKYNIVLDNREGPTCGANVFYTFSMK